MAATQDRAAGRGVLAAACVSALVVNANTSAVTILLPSISEDVGAPVAQLQWAVTGYSLVGAAVIVTSGALGDMLGRRKIFLGGLALFVASCVLIALSTGAAGVVGGRMIQGASGATILACGMSLLSVAASGSGQMKAITIWGAASAAGAALGPLVGGVLVDTTGWQGLFWIDAAIAAACVPLTLATVQESRDPQASSSIDWAGTVLIALVLAPLILALSKGNDWGWASAATLGCFAITVVATLVVPAGRAEGERPARQPRAPAQPRARRGDAGDPHRRGHDQRADVRAQPVLPESGSVRDERSRGGAGDAARGRRHDRDHATDHAARGPHRRRRGRGARVRTRSRRVRRMAFVEASWTYGAFVVPLVALAVGLGVANGPASSGSTSSVSADEVGQASGISNMARYIGAAVAVAIVATIFNAVTNNHQDAGESAADALAAGLSAASLTMAIWAAAGVLLVRLLAGQRLIRHRAIDRAAAAASTTHTIPTEPARAS